eukprot:217643-Rhodomonas_salina.2
MKSTIPKRKNFHDKFDTGPDGPLKRLQRFPDRVAAETNDSTSRLVQQVTDENILKDRHNRVGVDVTVDLSSVFEERLRVDDVYPEPEPLPEPVPHRVREKHEAAHRPIIIFPTQETYVGTEWEAIILKWHYR